MRPSVALLPSPLLGPAVWHLVATALRDAGWQVREVPAAAAPSSPATALATYLSALPAEPLIVVPHSNAGLFVPAVAAARDVRAMVFVDAGLPPASGPYLVAPVELCRFLEKLADDEGLLPVWTEWWDEEVAALFPSSQVRAVVEAEQRRLPLSYFTGSLTAEPGWERPAAYLAFSDTYDAERADARRRGWPVTTLVGGHLHMLVDPEQVATELDRLLTILTHPNPPSSAVE